MKYKDCYCGVIGDVGVFSFNWYKNINIGEGGVLVINDDCLFVWVRNYYDLGSLVCDYELIFNELVFVGVNMCVIEIEGVMLNV